MGKVILIGGSSHAGKSTLAQILAEQLGWACHSTDKLARHPGRPWAIPPATVPPHVPEYFRRLSEDELLADVCRHYLDNVGPLIREAVSKTIEADDGSNLVLEGSAIMPGIAAELRSPQVDALYLTIPDEAFSRRMRKSSGYDDATPPQQQAIDKFLKRCLAFNRYVLAESNRLGIPVVETHPDTAPEENAARVLTLIRNERR